MPKYRLKYGFDVEFDAQGAGEVVPMIQSGHRIGSCEDERRFCRRMAIELCEWSGGNYYYHSRDALAGSMIRNGLLEVID